MNNDRLNGITTFVRAVEAGSFSLAAERMNLTRSAVGKTIARLEQRLGVLLFQRTSRKQKLTTEGQVYYERCLRALAELDAADAELNSGRLQPQGVLRISAPKLIGRHCITPVLTTLIERYPDLQIEMIYSDRVADLIEDGLDLAVRVGPWPTAAAWWRDRLDNNIRHCAPRPLIWPATAPLKAWWHSMGIAPLRTIVQDRIWSGKRFCQHARPHGRYSLKAGRFAFPDRRSHRRRGFGLAARLATGAVHTQPAIDRRFARTAAIAN